MKAINSHLIYLLTAAALIFTACTQNRYTQFGGYAQGGTWSVKANLAGVKVKPAEIQKNIDAILEEIDTTLSGYNKASQLSRLNAGEDVQPSPMFKEVVAAAERFKEETDGAVDCFAGAVFDKWGFGFGPGMNFNAIAQGYSCDRVAAYLYSIGVKDMLVDIGEIFCDGLNPKGKPWRVGVDRPVDGNNTPGADLDGIWESNGKAQGIVTSGNYRKFYIKDGKKYSHTIDPRSGYPVEHNLLSATIVAPTSLEADAYATYCMVIGLDAAREFILSRPDLEGYLIAESEWASPGFNLIKQ